MAVSKEQLHSTGDFEQFIALPQNAARLFELINGEIVEKVPTQRHGVITVNISTEFKIHVKRTGSGRIVVEVRHRMPGDKHNDRLPDVAYYADASRPSIDQGPVPYMPDLAVEIQSPGQAPRELREKASYYLRNGSKIVWIVFPQSQTIEVCMLNEDAGLEIETKGMNDTLNGGSLLTDFSVAVNDIFAE